MTDIGVAVLGVMKAIVIIFILLTFGKELRPLLELLVNAIIKAVNS